MSRYRSNRLPAASGHAVGIGEAVNDFLLHHQRKGDSESYLRELRSYLIGGSGCFGKRRAWLPFMPWVREAELSHIGDLTKERIGAYLDHARENASKGDYGKVCAILKRLFGFFIVEQWLESEPLRIERPKRLKAEIKVFTPDEVERMRQAVAKENARDWAIFMLLLDTGIRASELCNLCLEDVRWDRQELIIRPQIAKNRSFRIVPLSGSVKALRKYRAMRGDTARCDRLFLAFYHTPVVSKCGVRRNIDKIVFCDNGLTRNGLFFLVKKWGDLVLEVVAAFGFYNADALKDDAEPILTRLDYENSLEWEIPKQNVEQYRSNFHKFEERGRKVRGNDPYFTSDLPPGLGRLTSNLSESALYTRAIAKSARNVVLIVITISAIAFCSLLGTGLYRHFGKGHPSGNELFVSALTFLVTIDLVPLALKYNRFTEAATRARTALSRANGMDEILPEVIEYQLARASAPLLPTFTFLKGRTPLAAIWTGSIDHDDEP